MLLAKRRYSYKLSRSLKIAGAENSFSIPLRPLEKMMEPNLAYGSLYPQFHDNIAIFQ